MDKRVLMNKMNISFASVALLSTAAQFRAARSAPPPPLSSAELSGAETLSAGS